VRVPSTDDVTLELHHFGGDGPPVLIVHATGFLAAPYRAMLPHLADRFEVWALDVRGHGDSTVPADGTVSWQGAARDVAAAVAAIDRGPVGGIGHSMGGASLLTAEVHQPGTIAAAYLFEPIVFPRSWLDAPGPNPLAEAARRRRPSFATRSEALHRYAARPPLGWFRADVLASYVDEGFREEADGTVTLKCAPAVEAATFDAPDKLAIEALGVVQVPVLVARGELDPGPGPAELAGPIAAALPRGELRSHPHLTHFGPLQDPVTVGREAAAFLGHHLPDA
jgi:pimeloyl-ACP methyl ester carboxylesterase